MHSGRIGHPKITGEPSVAPSAITPAGEVFTGTGQEPFVEPRALSTEELPGIVEEIGTAAQNAIEAGVDGVELHAANGYLLQQFLADGSNQRTDSYGGSPANRARFVIEVATAVSAAIGAGRVGIRISPGHPFNDMNETEVEETYDALLDGLASLGLLYLHVLEAPDGEAHARLRKQWDGAFIYNTGFTEDSSLENAQREVDSGEADLICFGRQFLANPDLVERLKSGVALNEPKQATFYGGGAEGYTDYPFTA